MGRASLRRTPAASCAGSRKSQCEKERAHCYDCYGVSEREREFIVTIITVIIMVIITLSGEIITLSGESVSVQERVHY